MDADLSGLKVLLIQTLIWARISWSSSSVVSITNDKNLLGSPNLQRGGCSDCRESGVKKKVKPWPVKLGLGNFEIEKEKFVKKEIEEEVKKALFNSWPTVSGLAGDGVVSSPN
jgi:mRNA degradation ribonuclease J1/J2